MSNGKNRSVIEPGSCQLKQNGELQFDRTLEKGRRRLWERGTAIHGFQGGFIKEFKAGAFDDFQIGYPTVQPHNEINRDPAFLVLLPGSLGVLFLAFDFHQDRPDRAQIKEDWIKAVIEKPTKIEIQSDGRIRKWAKISEVGKYSRVILLDDSETVHNAFFDRSYKEE